MEYKFVVEFELSEEDEKELRFAYDRVKESSCYKSFEEFLADVTEFRIVKHVKENAEILVDWDEYFCYHGCHAGGGV